MEGRGACCVSVLVVPDLFLCSKVKHKECEAGLSPRSAQTENAWSLFSSTFHGIVLMNRSLGLG